MSNGHTPGPWTDAGPGKDGRTPWYIRGPVGYRNAPQPAVATVPSCLPRSECAANARLIAAAPDLLQALKRLVDAVDNDMTRKYPASFPGFVSAIGHALAAIAKAEGRTQGARQ